MRICLFCFEQKVLTEVLKKILIDEHYKTIYEPVRSEYSSCRMLMSRVEKEIT